MDWRLESGHILHRHPHSQTPDYFFLQLEIILMIMMIMIIMIIDEPLIF